MMKLYDEKKYDLNEKLSKYLPELDTTNKSNILIRDVLTHQAQLKSWIPFYIRTIDNNRKLKSNLYNDSLTSYYNLKVADNIYITDKYIDTIYQRIYATELLKAKKYKYSDLGFYLLFKLIDSLSGEREDKFLYDNFYNSLGAYTLCYNPLTRFPKQIIVPTEDDKVFRKQLVQGSVHDYGSAMMGGVCGHAGLFSNANDIAKILQMLLQNGTYAKKRYIDSATVKLFTTKAPTDVANSRRALGFDRTENDNVGTASYLASDISYGHTGFTGTLVWIDPESNFIFIFLSNRINPSIENEKINEMNIRGKVQSIFYKSF